MWFPIWIGLTSALLLGAWRLSEWDYVAGFGIVLGGLIASRIAVGLEFPNLSMMAVWVTVALLLFSRDLYGMALFAALSSAAYFPLWTTYAIADMFGVLMLIVGGGGLFGFHGSYDGISDGKRADFYRLFLSRNSPDHRRDSASSVDTE